mgnify:CR=1 FL=1
MEEEEEIHEFRANRPNLITFSTTQSSSMRSDKAIPASIPASSTSNIVNIADIKAIIRNAINPLVDEIKGLKEEI